LVGAHGHDSGEVLGAYRGRHDAGRGRSSVAVPPRVIILAPSEQSTDVTPLSPRHERSLWALVIGTLLLAVHAFLSSGCHKAVQGPAIGDEPTLAIEGPHGIVCGAVAFAPNLAVTASHCVPGRIVRYTTLERRGVKSRTGTGFVVRRDAASDLAAFTGVGLVPAELSRSVPDPERSTRMVAHVPLPWSTVRVHPRELEEGFLHTERLEAGASGSGLWSDAGELVGVAIGNDSRSGYFASIPRISRMLRGTIEVAVAASDDGAPPPPDAHPAVWGDQHLGLDELFAGTKSQRRRIADELDARASQASTSP
jgi:hypothetical protein